MDDRGRDDTIASTSRAVLVGVPCIEVGDGCGRTDIETEVVDTTYEEHGGGSGFDDGLGSGKIATAEWVCEDYAVGRGCLTMKVLQ